MVIQIDLGDFKKSILVMAFFLLLLGCAYPQQQAIAVVPSSPKILLLSSSSYLITIILCSGSNIPAPPYRNVQCPTYIDTLFQCQSPLHCTIPKQQGTKDHSIRITHAVCDVCREQQQLCDVHMVCSFWRAVAINTVLEHPSALHYTAHNPKCKSTWTRLQGGKQQKCNKMSSRSVATSR